VKIQTVRPASERLVLTTVQAPLWLEQLNLPGKPIANTGLSVTLHGDLDVSTFVEAVRLVVDETDTLRIRLHMERESVYQEVVDLPDYLVEQVDFSQSSDPAAASDAWIEKHLWETIAWDSFPLFQFTLIKLSPHRHIWLQKSNHLVIDGPIRGPQVARHAILRPPRRIPQILHARRHAALMRPVFRCVRSQPIRGRPVARLTAQLFRFVLRI